MEIYIIASGDKQIWAINPKTRERLRLKLAKDRTKVLDVYASNSGVYHASEQIRKEQKKIKESSTEVSVNYIQIVDSLSGKTSLTINPPGAESLPLEERLIPLDFTLVKHNGALLYTLNGTSGVIFPNCNGEIEQSGKTTVEENALYFDGKKIATLDENIRYAKEVDAQAFARAFRIKNKIRYDKNREFLA